MGTLAILSALDDEQKGFLELLTQPRQDFRAGRTFWRGRWHDQDVVLALSRIGKVAAASTAVTLIEAFGVDRIVFTGVAGGLGDNVRVGGVMVAQAFVQHDMDSSPLFARYEVPMYGTAKLPCDPGLNTLILEAVHAGLQSLNGHFPTENRPPCVHTGLIASGDRFVSSAEDALRLRSDLHTAGYLPLAVEMEGAAVAQVCFDYGVPFAVVRTISDRADDQAHMDFSAFVRNVASPYALSMLQRLIPILQSASA